MIQEWSESRTWKLLFEHGLFSVEIQNHGVSHYYPIGCWNSYIIMCDSVRYDFDKEAGSQRYVQKNLVLDKVWDDKEFWDRFSWNGGQTFLDKSISYEGQRRLKVGDDYQHSWDHDSNFAKSNLERVGHNIVKIAEELETNINSNKMNE